MIEVPAEKVTSKGIADAYKSATEVFKKPYLETTYQKLFRNGRDMLELGGIEERMENLMFFADQRNDRVQFWIGIKNNMTNYDSKQAEFEKQLMKYFA